MTLLDDLAAPGGHSSVQQALAHALRVGVHQLRDVVDGFQSLDLDALTVALELNVTLTRKNRGIIGSHTGGHRNIETNGFTYQQKNGGQDLIYGFDLLF